MPVSLKRIRETGGLVFLHLCEDCGEAAPFGVGVSYRLAIRALAAGDAAGARAHLGRWYCGEHVPPRAAGG